jgi:hypothetical protein
MYALSLPALRKECAELIYLLIYGAEPFLRICQLCSYSRISQHFKEPEGLLPCSQSPPLVPILSHINPVHTIPSYFSEMYFNIVTHLCPRLLVFKMWQSSDIWEQL